MRVEWRVITAIVRRTPIVAVVPRSVVAVPAPTETKTQSPTAITVATIAVAIIEWVIEWIIIAITPIGSISVVVVIYLNASGFCAP